MAPESDRLFRTITIAPLAGAAAGMLASVIAARILLGPAAVGFAAMLSLILWMPATLVSTLLFGMPWLVWMETHGMRKAISYWAPAASIGATLPWIISLFEQRLPLLGEPPPDATANELFQGGVFAAALLSALGAICGGVTGWSAWLVRRPDRDALANPVKSVQ